MTQFTDEVRDTLSPYKFGNDRRAAAMWLANLDGCEDESTGDASEWRLWVARYGRNLCYVDDQGFVESYRFPNEAEAKQEFARIAEQYERDTSPEPPPAGYVPEDSYAIPTDELEAAYRVAGWPAVAWRIVGLPEWRGEDYEWSGMAYVDPSQRVMVMVGDDSKHTFDVDELERIADDEYCKDCGQIGCGWHV